MTQSKGVQSFNSYSTIDCINNISTSMQEIKKFQGYLKVVLQLLRIEDPVKYEELDMNDVDLLVETYLAYSLSSLNDLEVNLTRLRQKLETDSK